MQYLGLCLVIACSFLEFSDATKENVDCLRPILEDSFVRYAAVYFADNPRGDDSPISPASLDPPTAKNLFEAYYGSGASASGFKSSISRILYSGLDRSSSVRSTSSQDAILEADKVLLRSNIYTYIKAGSYDLSREKFGALLYNSFDELSNEFPEANCFAASLQKQMQDLIHAELARLRNEVGEYQFGQFLGLGSGTTLAFAIDDTGSMGGEIDAAKRRAISIIDERQGSLDQPQNFVLVPFNDPGVGPLTVTHDAQAFKNAINRLYAHGGGDAPELSMTGIQLAVENSNPGSTIFVITDIDSKDVDLQDNVVAQAKQKNIKVMFLLTNNRIGDSGCRRACDNPSLKRGLDLYKYIAESTGGRILIVGKNDIFRATEVIESELKQGLEDLLIRKYTAGEVVERFFVDSSLDQLFVQSEGDCGNITMKGPDEAMLLLKGDVEVDKLVVLTTEVNGTFGEYSLELTPTGDCDITISAASTKGFIKTLAKRIIDPENGAVTFRRFEGQPLRTDEIVVLLDEFGKVAGDRTETVYLEDKESKVNYEFPISDQHSSHHSITLTETPESSLFVKIVGVDSNGHKFQRISPVAIEFVSANINCDAISNLVFRAGDSVSANVSITNIGQSTEVYSLEVNDDKGYVVANGARRVNLTTGSSAEIQINFSSGKNEQIGTVSTVTITASPQGSDNLIFKQCRLIIGQKERPEIESFDVVSNINSRFVETSVESTVFNNASVSRMAEFNVIMPLDSFITEFSMTIDNVTYPGEIEEKETAERIFEAARARGVTAGHVAAREKSTTVFKTSVNLEANKRVVFNLKYQQLLRRTRGKYRHEVIIQTEQPVGRMSVDVYICETRPLAAVNVLGFDTEQSVIPGPIKIPGVTVDQQRTTAHISFKPTREEQLRLSPLGLNGKFVVEYDVARERGKEVNEVIAQDRHFVHFFTADMEPMSKRVVFVLDNSASMHGRKMEQVRNAMAVILDGLNEEDSFAIVMFNSNVTTWKSGTSNMAMATEENVESAKEFLQNVTAEGSTNIELAIRTAIEVFGNFSEESEKSLHPASDFILLLTDGRPTEGTVQESQLISLLDRINNRTYGIHTIGFGSLVDMQTLAKIAARNNGSSVQIFEDINADLQISDFFETFGRPMLRDIELTYIPEQVETTTMPIYPVLIQGQEIVVGGSFADDFVFEPRRRRRRQTISVQLLDVTIRGKLEDKKDFELEADVELTSPAHECLEDSIQIVNFTERLNAFMELQHMVKEIAAENNKTVKDELKQEALNQSLEFGFVTPGITSMVVLKPEDKKDIEKELEKEDKEREDRDDEEEGDDEEAEEEIEVDYDDISYLPATSIPPTTFIPFPEDSDGFGSRSLAAGGGETGRIMGGMIASGGERRMVSPPRRPPPRSLAFFGDPHFVVKISPQITICFEWKGHEGQIFNILQDDSNGLTVNGRLKILRASGKHSKRIFVDKIGINLSHENVTIEVTCYDIVVTDNTGQITKHLYDPTRTVEVAGIRMTVVGERKKNFAKVLLEIKQGVSFQVIRRLSANEDNVANHLDFTVVDKDGISEDAFGVLGQFSHDDTKEEPEVYFSPGKNTGVLWYKKKPVETRQKIIRDYNRYQMIDCWFLPEPERILDRGRFRYFVEGMFDQPDLKRDAPRPRKRRAE